MSQRGTANLMTVVVANNGQPNLSATQNFMVTVLAPAQPVLGPTVFTNGVLQSLILGDFGPDYSVLKSTDLMNWASVFTTNSPLMPCLFMDSTATNYRKGFFRVQLGP